MTKDYAYTSNSNLHSLGEQYKTLKTLADEVFTDWCSGKEGLHHRSGAQALLEVVETGDTLYMCPKTYQMIMDVNTIEFYVLQRLTGVNIINVQDQERLAKA